MSKDTGIFREPPKPEGLDEDQRVCATKGCGRKTQRCCRYCDDCWDSLMTHMEWFQKRDVWSGK